MTERFRLDPKKLSGLTTDGAPAMVGKHKRICKNILEAFGPQNIILNHCIIHQENVCNKALDGIDIMKEVVQSVNHICCRGINHRQFKLFLEKFDCHYPDITYFSSVRWLNRAETLKRFWSLRNEIKCFMESKNQNVSFFCDVEWLNDLAFLTDVTRHLSMLNTKLQGRNQLENKIFEHMISFQKKLDLFEGQLSKFMLTHFPCLKIQNNEGRNINYQKYQLIIDKFSVAFDACLLDFRKLETNFKILSNPFQSAPDQSPNEFQLELIDLQSSNDIKSAFNEIDLVTWHKKLCS